MIMNNEFKEYYKFPLKMWEFMDIKVFTNDDKMAFDWLINIPRDIKQKIIDRINGIDTKPYKIKKTFYLKDGIVYCRIEDGPDSGQEIKLFRMRGWGMLTGPGGYHLPQEKAAEIQDAFADYCVEMLNKK
jgi:hypothetical protein